MCLPFTHREKVGNHEHSLGPHGSPQCGIRPPPSGSPAQQQQRRFAVRLISVQNGDQARELVGASNRSWAIRTEGRKRCCWSRWNTSTPRQSSKTKRQPITKRNGNGQAWSSSPMDPAPGREAPPDTRSCGRRTRSGRDSRSTLVARRKHTMLNRPRP